VLDGADPRRILLLTFSRRAAAEMERRAGRVLHQALGLRSHPAPPELPWCGTFHAWPRGCCASMRPAGPAPRTSASSTAAMPRN
jgi:hypothetical protein